MADSLPIQIAEAVTSLINGHVFLEQPETFTAVRQYLAVYTKDDLAAVKVSVAAVEQKDKLASRGTLETDFGIVVDLQRLLSTAPPHTAEIDSLVNFIVEMKTFFDTHPKLASPLEQFWVFDTQLAGGNGQLWAPDGAYFDHTYEAALQLVVRGQH
jgi:hypothetical protein